MSDLQPYTCIVTSCDKTQIPYPNKQTWADHLDQEHGFFDSLSNPDGFACALCKEHIKADVGRKSMVSHLARHLEEVSLTILPGNAEVDDNYNYASNESTLTSIAGDTPDREAPAASKDAGEGQNLASQPPDMSPQNLAGTKYEVPTEPLLEMSAEIPASTTAPFLTGDFSTSYWAWTEQDLSTLSELPLLGSEDSPDGILAQESLTTSMPSEVLTSPSNYAHLGTTVTTGHQPERANDGAGPPEEALGCYFSCDKCDEAFRRQGDLRKHQKNHTRRRCCPLCNQGFAERKDLNRHLWVKHPKEAHQYGVPGSYRVPCPHVPCPYIDREDNVRRHIKLVHSSASTPKQQA